MRYRSAGCMPGNDASGIFSMEQEMFSAMIGTVRNLLEFYKKNGRNLCYTIFEQEEEGIGAWKNTTFWW